MTMTDMGSAGLLALGEEYGLRAVAQRVVRDAWQGALDVLDQGAARLDRWRSDEARDQRSAHRIALDRMRADDLMVTARTIWATPPEVMAAAPVAPARGCMRLVEGVEADGLMAARVGWDVSVASAGLRWEGQCQLQIMVEIARRAHVKRIGSMNGFVAPFTPGQIQMGQRYATLIERHAAGGMKCTAIGRTGGGGQGGDFMDTFVAEGREIDMIRTRIGTGQAMIVRRVRPSDRGTKSGITDRRLVDMVCLGGKDLTAVLAAHGWDRQVKQLHTLRVALAAALDRMQGYSDGRGTKGD